MLVAGAARAGERPAESDVKVAAGTPAERLVAQLGKREVILASGQQGLKYFPDACLAFVQTAPSVRVLMAAGVSTVLLEGRDMRSLASRGVVLSPGAPGAFDNGYAGVSGCARDPANGALLAFYHAEDHENMPAIPGGIPGFYCCVALAVSQDDGASFTKRSPIITGSQQKNPQGRADQGCGDLCVCADAQRRFVYVYYCDHSRINNRGVQICLVRAPLNAATKTDAWKKYYGGSFTEPGVGGNETPIVSAIALPGDAIFPQVTYVPEWRRYVMVFNIIAYLDMVGATPPVRSGIYLASSRDAVHWSKPTQLLAIRSVPNGLGREIGWHPTLFISHADARSARGWLYYSYSESWGHRPPHTPHYLVGQPISLSVSDAPSPGISQ